MNFENVKLVDLDQLATKQVVEEKIELAVQQAQGWGLNLADSILLRLAYEASQMADAAAEASGISAALDESQKALKGLQLENGRLKKRIANAEEAATNLAERVSDLEDELESIDADLDDDGE